MKPLLLLLALPVAAHASWFEYEAGAGLTSYETEDGRWYQQRMQHDLTTIAPEYSVGVTGTIVSRGAWGVDWHADYVNLGRAAASCQCTTSDADYAAHRRGAPTAYFSGSGRAQGVVLTLEPYRWYRGWRFGVEAGAYVYRATWQDSVTAWTDGLPDMHMGVAKWNAAPVVGVSVGDGKWSVNYRHYFTGLNSRQMNVPPLWNDADVIEIKRRF